MVDGTITIAPELVTDKFDKQIENLEKKMQKEEDKKIIIETKLSGQEKELEKARKKANELKNAYQELKEVQDKLTVHQGKPEDFMTFQDLQSTYGSLKKLSSSLDKALTKQNAIEQKVAQTKYRYDDINTKVNEYKSKIEQIKLQKHVSEVEQMKKSFSNVGNSIENSIKKVGRLALGIFGIRSAYMALRRASSDLAGYDDQHATNLEYIRFVLTQAIAPVLRGIVSLAMKLLQLINMIVNALFGVNLFSKGSAESFNKMKKGASGVSKAVKEIKKQLTGFDEINILTAESDSGTSAGAGGVGMPSMDLSSLQGEPPEWIKWLADNKDLIFAILAGIASGLIAIKLGLEGIQALGIEIAIAGIIYAIQSLIAYLNDGSWENFVKIIQGIGVAIIGLGIIIGSVPVAVAGAIVLIVGTIVKYWEQVRSFLQGGIDWLKGRSDWIRDRFGDTIGDIYDAIVRAMQAGLNLFDSVFIAIKGILDGIIELITGVFTGNWEKAWQGVKNIFTSLWNGIIGILRYGIGTIVELLVAVGKTAGLIIGSTFKLVVNSVLWAIEAILNVPIRQINGLIDIINAVPRN